MRRGQRSAVADGPHEADVVFQEIGPVELKGVAGAVLLLRAVVV